LEQPASITDKAIPQMASTKLGVRQGKWITFLKPDAAWRYRARFTEPIALPIQCNDDQFTARVQCQLPGKERFICRNGRERDIEPRRLRRRIAFLDRLLQHLSELRCVLMTVNLHRVLHGHFEEFLLTVRGYCDCTLALRRHFPAIDIFPTHGCLLQFSGS
jgi:hypothetical protein